MKDIPSGALPVGLAFPSTSRNLGTNDRGDPLKDRPVAARSFARTFVTTRDVHAREQEISVQGHDGASSPNTDIDARPSVLMICDVVRRGRKVPAFHTCVNARPGHPDVRTSSPVYKECPGWFSRRHLDTGQESTAQSVQHRRNVKSRGSLARCARRGRGRIPGRTGVSR